MSIAPTPTPGKSVKNRVIGSLATLTLAGIAIAGAATAGTTPAAVVAPTQTSYASGLPFAMPSASALKASGKLAFAHYMPSLPMSLDNKATDADYWANGYLNPNGESGKHAAYGGFVRDRPLGRTVRTGDYRLADMQEEVRQAQAAGIDGFSMDLLAMKPTSGTSALYDTEKRLLQAAQNTSPDFSIMLVPDVSGGNRTRSAADWAATIAELGAYKSAHRLADGRLVVAPFLAEAHDVAWWTDFSNIMKNTYGMPVALMPMFLNEQPQLTNWQNLAWGITNWGSRNPAHNNPDTTTSTSPLGRAKAVTDRGKVWMQPVSVQDERPRSYTFDEAENTQNLRNTWKIAMSSSAKYVQLVTWNDYVEGSSFAPSKFHGWSYLDINAYYLAQWKTGKAPTITRDAVYVTHRIQMADAKPTFPETRLMAWKSGSPARNTVEALGFLTAPGTITITSNGKSTSCNVPAGVQACVAPLGYGTPSVTVSRAGATVASVVSDDTVTPTPYVQDLQYTATSSARKRSGAAVAGAPVVTPTTPAPVVTTPAPVVTTPAPVVTTPAPVVTTPAPVVTTPAPVVTTPAPVVTTPAPVVTTPAPVVTTPAPVVTTPAPVVVPPAPVVTKPADPVAAYVTRVYRDLFGRQPDAAGLSGWTASLRSGTPYAAVSKAISNSPESRSRLIVSAYSSYLGRTPDPGGMSGWLAAMNNGMVQQQLETMFVSSPEYFQSAGGTNARWVTKLYADVLDRQPTAQEIGFWVRTMDRGANRQQVAAGFLYSTEHLTSVLDGYYQQLLSRKIDTSGRQSWVAAMQTGTRIEDVIACLMTSQEYINHG